LKPYFGVEDETASRTTSIQEGSMIRTSHLLIHTLHLQWSKYKDLSLELVPSNLTIMYFLGTHSHIHENMMLPKSDVFVTFRNDGPRIDERDKHWSMIVHGDGIKRLRLEEDATSGDFRTFAEDWHARTTYDI
jgi:hypothetical protein